jgi:hypothetical protein|nr:hypothetical protein [Pseudomonadales bacterium]
MNITPNLAPAPWSVRHFQPAAPVGKKLCAVCRKPMNARDAHARCQSCRNGGGYLAVKYRAICGACRKPFIKGKSSQKGCTISCGQLIRGAEARAKRGQA